MTESPPPNRSTQWNARLSLIFRVAFYVVFTLLGLTFIPGILYYFAGPVVAATIGLFVLAVLANLLTMRIFDRRPLVDIGLEWRRGSSRNLLYGILFGAAAAALMLSAPLLAGVGHLVPRDVSFSWANLLFFFVVLLFGAVGEEMLFRGYAFQILIEMLGPFATILPVAVLFGLGHASNPSASTLGILNTVLWGILLGYAFVRTRDLWLPIGLHFGWNAVLPLFGVNLSGLTIEVTRYAYRWDLGPLWSGGNYGPEGGLLTTIAGIALFFVLAKAPLTVQPAAIAVSLNEPESSPPS